jgi:hypothetical protein
MFLNCFNVKEREERRQASKTVCKGKRKEGVEKTKT